MGKFSDKVFGANVDKKTIDIFNALQRGQYEFRPGEPVTDLPEHSKYLGEKTTFARMWVALQISGSDVKNDVVYYSINDNKFNSYEPNQPIDGESYFVENTENPYLKPTAGITSITTRTEGSLGAVRRTTVEFVVHNKNDFDNIYLPFFLKPGATVVPIEAPFIAPATPPANSGNIPTKSDKSFLLKPSSSIRTFLSV